MNDIAGNRIIVLALATVLSASVLRAQGAARVSGLVLNEATRAAIAGARVELTPGAHQVVSDDSGHFLITSIAPGNVTLVIWHLGFEPESLNMTLGRREDRDVIVELLPAVRQLDTVAIAGKAVPAVRGRLSAFHERRMERIGRYIDSTDIERLSNRRLSDIMIARLPGTRAISGPQGTATYIASARTVRLPRMFGGGAPRRQECYVTVYLDGIIVTSGGAFDVNSLDPSIVAGIEFYHGAGQIPAQYNKVGTVCGVLLIWLK